MVKKLFVMAAFAASALSSAQMITEVFINPPGTDQGMEFLELQSAANFSWAGWYFITIDGDGNSSGQVDQVVSLGSYTSGSNGLLLLRDDPFVLDPAPAPETSVSIFDFAPDIENGSNTYIIGFGTPPTSGADLDTNNDGTLDVSMTGFTVVDAIGMVEGDDGANNFGFGTQLGFTDFPFTPDTDGGQFTGDVAYRVLNSAGTAGNGWITYDTLGAAPGPFPPDPTEFFYLGTANPAPTFADVPGLSPGSRNITWGSAAATISGTVTLQDLVDPSGESVTIEIMNGSTLLQTINTTLASGGAFIASTSVVSGSNQVYIKSSTFLRKLVNVTFNSSGASGVNASLINGDVDGDNEIGLSDFGLLSSAFGSVDGDPGYSAAADLDQDGEVGLSDFGILSASFGEVGD